ncbi:Serine/Threonine-Protein Kinase 33 [Manis pentadactyla]|nr:Serine/Threonine-Protein Kinase 33 [Manis pentadactyla]
MPALTTGDTTSPSSLSNNAVFAQGGLESDMSATNFHNLLEGKKRFCNSPSTNLEEHTVEAGIPKSIKHYSAGYCLWHRLDDTNNTSLSDYCP